ncbi:hypothetical protein NC653_012808 [Populus alba x Populus x berolinensis]|uniref:Uncharacterized GPI-anchored protein At5g19230-like domain-containing protein n=1 Tax=Populus alba x Populus x berolinensis TaxID=444605 RepID=A0AAD6QSV3_9ROSI|nr:hypothetical protein NC653_012808 [Populus alba x Populus x berolinensis]
MVSRKASLFVFVLLQAIFLLSSPVHCDEEDDLLQGLNSYRHSLNLPALVKHTNAGCLADKIAGKLEDEPCTSARAESPVQIDDYPDLLSKCGIDLNHTNEGVALPVCVPHLVPTLLLTNYTRTPYARFINASRFSGAGLGHEDDWMVVVLTTSTPRGDFAGATSLVSRVGLGHCLVTLLLGALVEDGCRESAATIRISSKRKLAAATILHVFFDHIEALERCHICFYVLSSTIEEHPELHFSAQVSGSGFVHQVIPSLYDSSTNKWHKQKWPIHYPGLACSRSVRHLGNRNFCSDGGSGALSGEEKEDNEEKLNAFVKNGLVSTAPLCNKDIKENLVAALTVKKNACTIKQGKNKYSRQLNLLAMASLKVNICLFVLFHAIFLLSSEVLGYGGEELKLLKNINVYRTSYWDIPPLTNNKKARCVAKNIAATLEQPCNETTRAYKVKLDMYPDQLANCIDTNHTTDGVVLPVCLPEDGLDEVSLLHNYTRTRYVHYIKDPNFTGIGIGSNDYWMVVVLNNKTSTWSSSASANGLVSKLDLLLPFFVSSSMIDIGRCRRRRRRTFWFLYNLIEAKPNAFVKHGLVSTAPLCNRDIKENLEAAFTLKKNASTIKQGKNKYSSIKKLTLYKLIAASSLL